jgi:hypothetical protein
LIPFLLFAIVNENLLALSLLSFAHLPSKDGRWKFGESCGWNYKEGKGGQKRFNIKEFPAFKALKFLCFSFISTFFSLRFHEAKFLRLVFIVVTEEPFLVTQQQKTINPFVKLKIQKEGDSERHLSGSRCSRLDGEWKTFPQNTKENDEERW